MALPQFQSYFAFTFFHFHPSASCFMSLSHLFLLTYFPHLLHSIFSKKKNIKLINIYLLLHSFFLHGLKAGSSIQILPQTIFQVYCLTCTVHKPADLFFFHLHRKTWRSLSHNDQESLYSLSLKIYNKFFFFTSHSRVKPPPALTHKILTTHCKTQHWVFLFLK